MDNIVIQSKVLVNNSRRQLFVVFFVLIVSFCVLYVSLVNKVVFNIAEREDLEEKIVSIDSKIGELESEYISLARKVDLDLAYSLGFLNTSDVKFVSRDFSSGRSLSLLGKTE